MRKNLNPGECHRKSNTLCPFLPINSSKKQSANCKCNFKELGYYRIFKLKDSIFCCNINLVNNKILKIYTCNNQNIFTKTDSNTSKLLQAKFNLFNYLE